MVRKAFLLLFLAGSVFATGKKPIPQGPPGPPGKDGESGSHHLEMPLGAGVRWFDTPSWSGVTSYQYDPLHSQNTLSGLVIYKLGKDARDREIERLEARLDALTASLAASEKDKAIEEKPIKGVIWGMDIHEQN